MSLTILVLAPDPVEREQLRSALEAEGHSVVAAADEQAALRVAAERRLDLLVQGHALHVLGQALAPAELVAAALAVSGSIGRGGAPGERHQSLLEQAREAQQRLAHVIASSPAVLYTLRVDGRAFQPGWVGSNVEGIIGYAPHEIVDERWFSERVHPEDRARVAAQVDELLACGHVEREFRFRHKDGGYRWIRDEQRLLRDGAGRAQEVVGSWWDIGDRRRAEQRLAESEKQYRLLFDSNPHPMWVYDLETLRFLAVNQAAVRHYGYSREEFRAMTIKDIGPPEELPRLLETLEHDAGCAGKFGIWKHRCKDGAIRLVEIKSSPIVFEGRQAELVLAMDVTERVTLEGQLLQAQKMEAVGQLAGGVAHDFNNLLGVILGYTGLLLKDLGPEHPGSKRAEQVLKAAERAAELTRQLLAFSRKQVLEARILDLRVVVGEVETMLHRLIGEDVQIVTAIDPEIGRVKADPGQLQQVIVALAVNARDAMPAGGRLLIEAANAELDEAHVRLHPGAQAGRHVMLAVSDTGHGIDKDTLSHLFEPFFTTKEAGKGTGLGLATVFGVVTQSGGHVAVQSEVGQGTTFSVYLPRIDAPLESAQLPAALLSLPPGGSETLLVVEDADALRLMTEEILREAGYAVLAAADPQAALDIASGHAGPIQLMLTDVVMPGMGGRALADRMRSIRPSTRVVYMSGYTDAALDRHGTLAAGTHFIQKPFGAAALLAKLRAVLDEIRPLTEQG